jgi:hypothetical protein
MRSILLSFSSVHRHHHAGCPVERRALLKSGRRHCIILEEGAAGSGCEDVGLAGSFLYLGFCYSAGLSCYSFVLYILAKLLYMPMMLCNVYTMLVVCCKRDCNMSQYMSHLLLSSLPCCQGACLTCTSMPPSASNSNCTLACLKIIENAKSTLHSYVCDWHLCDAHLNCWMALREVRLAATCICTIVLFLETNNTSLQHYLMHCNQLKSGSDVQVCPL